MIRKIIRNYNRAKKFETNSKKLSEIDTQVILVEPVLFLAGYDIMNPNIIKRVSRNTRAKKKEFDIEVYKNSKLKLAIEVKALSSNEFNLSKIDNGIGSLTNTNNSWKNKNRDGVGQLRAYCLNYSGFKAVPILTNGYVWAIFKPSFINIKNLQNNITKNQFISSTIKDKDFMQKIVKKLR